MHNKPHTEESKRKIREHHKGMLGKKHSNETREKMSQNNGKFWLGKKMSEESNKKRSENNGRFWLGKHLSNETKMKMSEKAKKRIGKLASAWLGGISFEPYGLEFNEDLKEVIRNRDRRKCQLCEKTELEEGKKLSVHHIDYDKKNCNPNNLITLCVKCHIKTNQKRDYWLRYFKGQFKEILNKK